MRWGPWAPVAGGGTEEKGRKRERDDRKGRASGLVKVDGGEVDARAVGEADLAWGREGEEWRLQPVRRRGEVSARSEAREHGRSPPGQVRSLALQLLI